MQLLCIDKRVIKNVFQLVLNSFILVESRDLIL